MKNKQQQQHHQQNKKTKQNKPKWNRIRAQQLQLKTTTPYTLPFS